MSRKANLNSTADLKLVSDETLPSIMTGLGYKQDFTFENIRLGIGYACVVIVAITAYCDYYIGFNQMYSVIAVGVVLYTLLYGAYNYWIYYVERGLVYTGDKDGSKIAVRTQSPRHSTEYSIEVQTSAAKSVTTHSFTKWFNENGYLEYEKFRTLISTCIDLDKKTQ
ncbi:signal peptidase complex subunit 2 [Trichomonascus vanleenenianus]|uniref:signal peptidase complex subunit SPC2 n=1 Tax=Trichomonascus vanleenenianus TaxID=2268995 RepID=UPI003ECB04AC